ncbi:sugar transferase [Mucilaginibacter sp.]|uniref:sugar transferase n=1 Tax=Mucilaginibacter sp. TaxID=1882438 RepID=UPI002632183A|nr:sugar transferase [Mucilaginibacter sp.]MDB5031901.1 polysaccharide biosynthesis polyprenyl glycosylphosphotransferase [Mucilaginibacter sp.]
MKRVFDVCFAIIGIIVLSPVFILISIWIMNNSRGGVFYLQDRVGLNHVNFKLIKFRTMYVDSDKKGLLTIGNNDSRITPNGCWLRKKKLDELPQLFNILLGDMSFVGPRPEVNKYVNLYTPEQQRVLSIKPGITDWASIQYYNENELLSKSADPEKLYVSEIIPSKIIKNLYYIDHHNFWIDMMIIHQTLKKIIVSS